MNHINELYKSLLKEIEFTAKLTMNEIKEMEVSMDFKDGTDFVCKLESKSRKIKSLIQFHLALEDAMKRYVTNIDDIMNEYLAELENPSLCDE